MWEARGMSGSVIGLCNIRSVRFDGGFGFEWGPPLTIVPKCVLCHLLTSPIDSRHQQRNVGLLEKMARSVATPNDTSVLQTQ